MERGKWNDQIYYASEIAESFELEESIRKASTCKELICPDLNCSKPILRYCHGEIKGAFFAHLNNCDCDYAKYDRSNTPFIHNIKHIIYSVFSSQGYDVEMEVKILSHHYTHLLFSLPNGKKIALEFGTKKSTAYEIDELVDEYKKIGVQCKWVFVDEDETICKENRSYFLKRYLLNKNKYHDALLLNSDASKITQYVVDSNDYIFEGRMIRIANFPEIYTETASLENLTFEDEEITIKGFYKRYHEWLIEKKNKIKQECEQQEKLRQEREREEQLRQQHDREEKLRQEFERNKYEQIIRTRENKSIDKSLVVKENIKEVNSHESNTVVNSSGAYKNISEKMMKSKELFYDQNNYPLRLCLHCGEVKKAMIFDPYTFYEQNPNLGMCKSCKKNNVPKK